MEVIYRETKPAISLDHKRIILTVRPNSKAEKRAELIHEWHKALLHKVVPPLIRKWERRLNVKVRRGKLQFKRRNEVKVAPK